MLASIGGIIQVLAGWWDVYSHRLGRIDPWWNPAHLTLYLGLMVIAVAVYRGLRQRFESTTPHLPFVNTAGLKLVALGVSVEVIAGAWNEVVHAILRQEPTIAPAHALLTLGMLAVNLGLVVGLTVESGLMKHGILVVPFWRKIANITCLLLAFSSIWLASAGALIYMAGVLRGGLYPPMIAASLSLVASIILVAAKRVLPGFGSASVIGFVFNVTGLLFLLIYTDLGGYFPWGVLPLIVTDLTVKLAGKFLTFTRAVRLGAALPASLFYVTYFPFTAYLFPRYLAPLHIVGLLILGIVGAAIGDGIFKGLSRLVLREYSQR